MKCRECGGKIIVAPEGYYVCSNCGLVYDDFPVYQLSRGEKYTEYTIGSYILSSYANSKYNKVVKNLSNVNIKASYDAFYSALLRTEKIMKKICYSMDLSPQYTESIWREYVFVLQRIFKGGYYKRYTTKYISILAAILYIRLKSKNYYISSKQLVHIFKQNGYRFSLSNLMEGLHILRKIGYIKRREDYTNYINYIINKISKEYMLNRKIIYEKVQKILEKNIKFNGRNMKNIYAALVFCVIRQLYDKKISMKKYSDTIGISFSTLRENIRYIKSNNIL